MVARMIMINWGCGQEQNTTKPVSKQMLNFDQLVDLFRSTKDFWFWGYIVGFIEIILMWGKSSTINKLLCILQEGASIRDTRKPSISKPWYWQMTSLVWLPWPGHAQHLQLQGWNGAAGHPPHWPAEGPCACHHLAPPSSLPTCWRASMALACLEDGAHAQLSSELLLTAWNTQGFMTSGGRPDQSRAARIILKDYVSGKAALLWSSSWCGFKMGSISTKWRSGVSGKMMQTSKQKPERLQQVRRTKTEEIDSNFLLGWTWVLMSREQETGR